MKKLLNMKFKKLIIIYLICLVVFAIGGGIVTATVIKPELDAIEATAKVNESEAASKDEEQYDSIKDKYHHNTKTEKNKEECEHNKLEKNISKFELLDTSTRVVMIVLASITGAFVLVFIIIMILVILKIVFKLITCPECQSITLKNNDYCSKCGSLLYKKCPNCDSKVSRKHSFCKHCGTKLILSEENDTLENIVEEKVTEENS